VNQAPGETAGCGLQETKIRRSSTKEKEPAKAPFPDGYEKAGYCCGGLVAPPAGGAGWLAEPPVVVEDDGVDVPWPDCVVPVEEVAPDSEPASP